MKHQQSSDQAELREKILALDTTYDMGDKILAGFLPPNYYVDRLVDLITAHTKAILEQVIGQDENYVHAIKDRDMMVFAMNRRNELREEQRKTAQALLGVK